ncbi:MAG: hypothetical protein IPH85_13560 [Ignavibacteria bacterium]|nr:hypothetical protein [Ignavibacteria bacterium]
MTNCYSNDVEKRSQVVKAMRIVMVMTDGISKLTNNTIGKYVSTFKTFLSWTEERGAPVHSAFRKFKVDEEEVEVVALTWDEVQLLANVDLTENPRLDRVRDLFLLECYTGARFGDIQGLQRHPSRRVVPASTEDQDRIQDPHIQQSRDHHQQVPQRWQSARIVERSEPQQVCEGTRQDRRS